MKKTLIRSIQASLSQDLGKKIVLLTGPRQCGKTTLAKAISDSTTYLNYDNLDDRSKIIQRSWNRGVDLVIFDEIHKMPKWKSWIKGIYDAEGIDPKLLVTGSARLDTHRKFGDSLAGRHFYYRLHPFDLKEIVNSSMKITVKKAFDRLISVGGFPEPFLDGSLSFYHKWRQGHADIILKQDLIDYASQQDLRKIEVLIELLRGKVGVGLSINAFASDLDKDPKTVQKWLDILEELFIIFKVRPYSKDISRAVKKEPKYYFYDTGFVRGPLAQKLENLVACALLKEAHYQTDCLGNPMDLFFLKVKGGREIDFLLYPREQDGRPLMIEVKESDPEASPNFKLFHTKELKNAQKIQLVLNLKKNHKTAAGIEVLQALDWLAEIKI